MGGCILIGMLAAFGIFCSFWATFGWLLPGASEGIVICQGNPGFPERFFVRRYLFLVETGLLRCGLIVVDLGLAEQDRQWLRLFEGRIEIYTPEAFSSGLELERNRRE